VHREGRSYLADTSFLVEVEGLLVVVVGHHTRKHQAVEDTHLVGAAMLLAGHQGKAAEVQVHLT
jgi:hypothetical protein